MTGRSILLGLLGAAAVCAVTYFNDHVMRQTMFVGNNMPYSVFGGLILFILFVNPMLAILQRPTARSASALLAGLLSASAGAALAGAAIGIAFGPVAGVVAGLCAGAVAGAGGGGVSWAASARRGREEDGSAEVPTMLASGLAAALAAGLASGILAGAAAGAFAGLGAGIVAGLLSGLATALAPRLALATAPAPHRWPVSALAGGLASGLVAGAVTGVASSIEAGLFGALLAGTVAALLAGVAGGLLAGRRAVTGREFAVVLALTLAACSIPGSGLLRTFTVALMRPHHQALTRPGWKDEGVIEMAPKIMLADIKGREGGEAGEGSEVGDGGEATEREREEKALKGFVQGLAEGSGHVSPGDIPWSAWTRTLAFWVPVILLVWVGMIGLSVVVHRQWSRHEQLPYPVATFANSLLPGEGEAKGSVFRSRAFWVAAGVLLAVHMANYAYTWWPAKLVRIPLIFDFQSLRDLFPTFARGGGTWRLLDVRIYFTVVAVAYFVSSDVSLSLGLGPYLYCILAGILVGRGVQIEPGGRYAPNLLTGFRFGAFLGMLAVVAYAGRFYYWSVLRRSLFLKSREEVEPAPVWGMRVFLVCSLVFVADLVLVGLDWQLALLTSLSITVLFVVMSRIIAETGLFFIQGWWTPGVVIVGFLGMKAVGPTTALMIFLVSTVLVVDPREALMPFMVNSLRLLDERKVKIGRAAALSAAAVVIGLAVGLPVTLYLQYDNGTDMMDGWSKDTVPKFAFEEALRMKYRLRDQGSLEESESVSGFARLLRASPERPFLAGFAVALAAVLLFSAARLRFPWWPLHPVFFLTWSGYAGYRVANSFLIGWFVKLMVTKYGGEGTYRKLRPVMFGLIAGDMLGAAVPALIGAVYYFATGDYPRNFVTMPG